MMGLAILPTPIGSYGCYTAACFVARRFRVWAQLSEVR